jgi:chemosensory pili system protein ChpA (sensor histidine kinase/response regulator)
LEADEELDGLADLFEEDLRADEGVNPSEGFKLSSLPSEAEIQDIFSEDIFWQEEEEAPDDWLSSSTPAGGDRDEGQEQELAEIIPENQGKIASKSDADVAWAELDRLLADSASIEPGVPPSLDLALAATLPRFYQHWEDLESLLAEPASSLALELNDASVWSELAAIIDAGAVGAIAPTEESKPQATQRAEDEFEDLEQLLAATNQSWGGGATAVGGKGKRPQILEQTARVSTRHLDNLGNLIGELVVKRNRLEEDQERLRLFLDNLLNQVQSLSDVGSRMQDLYERTLLEGALLASRNRGYYEADWQAGASQGDNRVAGADHDLDALEMDRFTDFHLLSQEMIELIVRVRESASDIQFIVDETDQVARSLRQVTTQLQEGMTKSRMVPFAQTADRLPRAIRDISLKQGKQVKLQVEGKDVLIDKMIQEHLYSPMTHLTNNAITHGIETPAEREKKGKPREGQILLRAFLQGNQTLISISDDGAGIDAQKVKRKAIEREMIGEEEARELSDQEVYDLLFHAGFSTKDKADDWGGRGVGLDVVRTSLNEVRGTVTVDSTVGQGTTFTIRLPLTLSISKALCCLSNHARIAFPMDGVEDMKDFVASEISLNEKGESCIPWGDRLLPLQPLSHLLSYNRQLSRSTVYGGKQEAETISIVILRSAQNYLAVQVDQVLGEQEIVIKQIEGPIPKPPGVAGATVLGDGTVMPIADVLELIEISQGKMRADGIGSPWRRMALPLQPAAEKVEAKPTVLIVDDSITVRELLSLSFNKAGYRVEQARDGQEAWDKLRAGLPCDIVFCDIEMPRMNGLELLSNMQEDEKIKGIPVALLTSRGAERHRQVAAKLGASGYFTKPYTEKDLIDGAKRMIAGEVLLAGSAKKARKRQPEAKIDSHEKQIATPPPSTPHRPNNVVLIIDDSVMVREMLSMTFNKAGYDVEQARDGQEAWEKLRAGLDCDLILCDIEMPRMNGLELLSRIQEDEIISAIPIAMITSRGAQKMQNIAAERGARGYFVKPYIEEVLIDAAQRLIAGEVLLPRGTVVE